MTGLKMLLAAMSEFERLKLVARIAVELEELGLLTDEERQQVRAEIAAHHQRRGDRSDGSEFAA